MTVIQLHTPNRYDDQAPDGCLTSMALIARTGITFRQLDYWTRTDLMHPLPRPADADSGTPRYYPLTEVHRAATLRWLLNAGISLQTCRLIINGLLDTGHARLTDGLTIHLPEDH